MSQSVVVDNLRKYGEKPFHIAVVHGGPGAPGEMTPVARELSSNMGILEPLQTAHTIDGQVEELKGVLENDGNRPLTLIGFSWGAWLSYILVARYPLFVAKLILISSGPFEEGYATGIMKTRLNRLTRKERREALSLLSTLNSNPLDHRVFGRFGELMEKADSCELLTHNKEVSLYNPDIYHRVWEQASKLRNSGELLSLGERIRCPVVAIHGDHDPHPAEGVKIPLSRVIKNFRFVLLEECGHSPWLERKARDRFYEILRSEIIFINHSESYRQTEHHLKSSI
jgi:pimeloyl-ACP methyl ester carboxylesterase